MSVNAEEVVITDSASKFEALLYQFIKLYDRLTLEHSLMSDRELKLIKNLEGFNEAIRELNNVVTNASNALVEINNLDLKLSTVLNDNVTIKMKEISGSLSKVGSQVSKIIKETNRDTVDQVWDNLSELIKEIIENQLGKNLKFYNTILSDTTGKFDELVKEMDKLDTRNFSLVFGIILLAGIIVGIVLKHYIFCNVPARLS